MYLENKSFSSHQLNSPVEIDIQYAREEQQQKDLMLSSAYVNIVWKSKSIFACSNECTRNIIALYDEAGYKQLECVLFCYLYCSEVGA